MKPHTHGVPDIGMPTSINFLVVPGKPHAAGPLYVLPFDIRVLVVDRIRESSAYEHYPVRGTSRYITFLSFANSPTGRIVR